VPERIIGKFLSIIGAALRSGKLISNLNCKSYLWVMFHGGKFRVFAHGEIIAKLLHCVLWIHAGMGPSTFESI